MSNTVINAPEGIAIPGPYALVSHESAVEAIWALAANRWAGILDDENIWLVPDESVCVRTQGDLKRLEAEVDLAALGIRRRPVDLLVPNNSCFSRGQRARFHVWNGFFPPSSFVRVHDRVLISTPYFIALQLAMSSRPNRISRQEAEESARQDALIRAELGIQDEGSTAEEFVRWGNIARLARAVQVLSDFMGTYRYQPLSADGSDDTQDVVFKTTPIVQPDAFAKYLDGMVGSRGVKRARRVARLAFAGAASPMETSLALMLALPKTMGGFGLPRPQLNLKIPIDTQFRGLVSQSEIVADLCWPKQKVAVEYYGWDDHFGKGPKKVASDAARANSMTSLGWTVLYATYEQVNTVQGLSLLARQVADALGVTLANPTDLELVWRSRLLTLLLPKSRRVL